VPSNASAKARRNTFFISEDEDHCAICGKEISEEKRNKHLDHDHHTGLVRGYVCPGCNAKLGWFDKYRGEIEEHCGKSYHGTISGYVNRRCRCTRCKRAWSEYNTKRNRERKKNAQQ
jgi:hypothetical protein